MTPTDGIWMRRCFLLLLATLVPACGGGGGGAPAAGWGYGYGPGFGGLVTSAVVFQIGDAGGFHDLYAADDAGLTAVNLNGFLTAGGQVELYGFELSPDRGKVAFLADKDVDGQVDLYVVPVVGGVPVRVSQGLQPLGDVAEFAWSPDGNRIAYLADRETEGVRELYVAQADGTLHAKVSGTMIAGGQVSLATVGFAIPSPFPPNTHTPPRVAFAWSPDGLRIAYIADQDVNNQWELHVTTLAGMSRSNLTAVAMARSIFDFQWSPLNDRLAYRLVPSATNGLELKSVPVTGVIVNASLSGGVTNARNVLVYKWSPDGQRVAYVFDKAVDDQYGLFTNLPFGGSEVDMTASLAGGKDVMFFEWSPNGQRVAYLADQDTDDQFELYSTLAAGGGNTKLSGSLTANGDVDEFAWSPDSAHLAYGADQLTDGERLLYRTDVPSGVNTLLSGNLVAGGSVQAFAWAPDSQHVAYTGASVAVGTYELFVIGLVGTPNQVPGVSAATTISFDWNLNADRIFFSLGGRLYSVNYTGGGPQPLLTRPEMGDSLEAYQTELRRMNKTP